MADRTKWADLLEWLPTLRQPTGADLKLKLDQKFCVYLAEDPFPRTVYVEQWDGAVEGWRHVDVFDGDIEDPHPLGVLGDAYRATVQAVRSLKICGEVHNCGCEVNGSGGHTCSDGACRRCEEAT